MYVIAQGRVPAASCNVRACVRACAAVGIRNPTTTVLGVPGQKGLGGVPGVAGVVPWHTGSSIRSICLHGPIRKSVPLKEHTLPKWEGSTQGLGILGSGEGLGAGSPSWDPLWSQSVYTIG